MTKTALIQNTEEYLVHLFSDVNKLVTEFYENTLSFNDTLNYTHTINTINSEAFKIIKNPENGVEYCTEMTKNLKDLSKLFSNLPQFKYIIHSIIIHNETYIRRYKKAPL